MFNRHARTAAASTALLLIAGVAVAQVAGTPVLDRTETGQTPAVVVTVDDDPSAEDLTERAEPASIDDGSSATDLAGDISGNCDEAEHAADDRCAGTTAPAGGVTSTTIDDHGGDDDSIASTTIDDHGGDDDSITSTTIDDHGGDDDSTTSTTIDDSGGDDDDDDHDSGKGRHGDDDDADGSGEGRNDD